MSDKAHEPTDQINAPRLTLEQCWFCEESTADPDCAATVETHAGGFVGKTTEYRVRETTTLSVPRCEKCKSAHDRVEGHVAKGGIIGLLIGILIALFYLYQSGVDISIKDDWKNLLIVIGVFGMIGGVVAWGFGRISIPKGVKDQRARDHYPLVQEKVRQGWKIGPKPPGL
ncbi:MAG TPA: hypothetical protein VM095_05050 [Pyrinomonadaceae bacterium]|nr:hypothetical protein [Pyrinomonadaceae bacterium]